MTTYDETGLHSGELRFTMRTYTGKKIDPYLLTPKEVEVNDIIHPLAYQCRYNGHSAGFLSVAAHSCEVVEWLRRHGASKHEQLAGLLHDGAEAYIGDMIRPLKKRPEFEHFSKLDDFVTGVILTAFKLPFTELPAIVHEADREVTNVEVHYGRFHFNSTPQDDEARFRYELQLYNDIHGKRTYDPRSY